VSYVCVLGRGEGDDSRREDAASEGKETAEEETEGGKGDRTRNCLCCICSPMSRCEEAFFFFFLNGWGVAVVEGCGRDKVGLSK
jgi:hypothetical protein